MVGGGGSMRVWSVVWGTVEEGGWGWCVGEGRKSCTCNRGAGVLQHAIDELQALIAMPDGPLNVELIHHQGFASCLCYS